MNTSEAPAITDAELKLLQSLVYHECGMHFDERRTSFLQDRLFRRLKECGMDSFYSYYRLLVSPQGKKELTQLVENLTVNETSFFRNKAQLELFQHEVLEGILARKQEQHDYTLKIWSAGCSHGQEPYTLVMIVTDVLLHHWMRNRIPRESSRPKPLVPPPWHLEILASDINYSVLRSAQEGSYTEPQMSPVDYGLRLRFFDKVGPRYVVKKEVKDLVHFDFHNLKTEFLPQHNDIIFCRNVMMYFDEAEQKRLVDKFHRCLNSSGYLFVGHAESLLGLTDRFQMVHHNSGTAYQRVEAKYEHSSR
ncbi:MAG: protein-glutamate O-methyltransferase CheR [Terriglobales bacterium]